MINERTGESVDSDGPARKGEPPPSDAMEEELGTLQRKDLERWEWEGEADARPGLGPVGRVVC